MWPTPPAEREPSDVSGHPSDSNGESSRGTAEKYRPLVHITPPEHWMNDPQRPIKIDGLWHFYYLYNSDYPHGNGTSWRHATSTDLVHWQDEGVAIEKFQNGLGDIETGSVVIDKLNTAGFGAGAVLATVTQQHDGVQRQSLFVSRDGGYSFADSGQNPVLDNPGTIDFRDPKVFWDEQTEQWTMVLAEGGKIGFYRSADLRTWTYMSGFERDDVGLLECPDLFPITLDGDEDNVRWILLSGANGEEYGKPHGTAYWVGDWDGTTFTPESDAPRWLDHGSDFYAAVTWSDPAVPEDEMLDSRYAIGWMNNWTYANQLPTDTWHGGQGSIVRKIRLTTLDEGPTLVSTPVAALERIEEPPTFAAEIEVGGGTSTVIGREPAGAYRLRATLDLVASTDLDELRIHLGAPSAPFATLGYDATKGQAFFARDADAVAHSMPPEYSKIRTVDVATHNGQVTFDILVDAASIEMFINSGEATLSSLVYLQPSRDEISIEAIGEGTALVSNLTVTPLDTAPGQPRATN